MSDPSLLFQGALVTALKASSGVGTSTRIYDKVPDAPTFPYVVIGDDQLIGDDVECGQISEIVSRIHVWSRAVGYPEALGIAAAIRDRLRTTALALAGFTIEEVQFEQQQKFVDPDGLSRHVVLEFRILIQHG